jgi:hypothetical protein
MPGVLRKKQDRANRIYPQLLRQQSTNDTCKGKGLQCQGRKQATKKGIQQAVLDKQQQRLKAQQKQYRNNKKLQINAS